MNVQDRLPRKRLLRDGSLAAFCALAAFAFAVLPREAFAQESKRQFSLPADIAPKTLKLFSEQSGRPLLADAHLVRTVKTNEVKGEFTVDEAMDRMLAGTGLIAAKDEKSGAFTVTRGRAPNAERRTQAAPGDRAGDSKKKT